MVKGKYCFLFCFVFFKKKGNEFLLSQACLFWELGTHEDARSKSHRGFHLHAGPHHGGEAAIPSNPSVQLKATNGTRDNRTAEGKTLRYEGPRWPLGPTEKRSLVFCQSRGMRTP